VNAPDLDFDYRRFQTCTCKIYLLFIIRVTLKNEWGNFFQCDDHPLYERKVDSFFRLDYFQCAVMFRTGKAQFRVYGDIIGHFGHG